MFWHIYVVCFQPNLPWSIDHFPAGCWHWRLAWCFFCICLGLLTVGSSQVQTQKWKQLQLATNHVWNRMLDFFVARCWERVQSFDWAMHFFGEADGDGGVWACWRLVPHRSKLKNGKSWSWQQSRLEQNADIFFVARCWERIQFFFTGLCFFFVSLTVTVGFGPVDGWFLTGPNSKLERVSASWQQITFGTECWIFFVARGWERVQSFDWAMHFCLVRLTVGPYR